MSGQCVWIICVPNSYEPGSMATLYCAFGDIAPTEARLYEIFEGETDPDIIKIVGPIPFQAAVGVETALRELLQKAGCKTEMMTCPDD